MDDKIFSLDNEQTKRLLKEIAKLCERYEKKHGNMITLGCNIWTDNVAYSFNGEKMLSGYDHSYAIKHPYKEKHID